MSSSSAPSKDWTTAFTGAFREEFCRTIRELPLEKLERFPPPKVGGLPIGHELRVVRRFLTGGSSMLEPSAFSGAYRRVTSKKQQWLYRGLALGEQLERDQWRSLIGSDSVDRWAEAGLLNPADGDRLACRFRVIVLGPLRLLIDHNDPFPLRIHIGQDSLNMVEFLNRHVRDDAGMMLDVGTGSGLQLLSFRSKAACRFGCGYQSARGPHRADERGNQRRVYVPRRRAERIRPRVAATSISARYLEYAVYVFSRERGGKQLGRPRWASRHCVDALIRRAAGRIARSGRRRLPTLRRPRDARWPEPIRDRIGGTSAALPFRYNDVRPAEILGPAAL